MKSMSVIGIVVVFILLKKGGFHNVFLAAE
jgi:hypothetical protein